LFDLNYEKMIKKHDWILLNSTENENNEIIEDLKGIIPYKLMKNFEKFIFYSIELKKYLAIPRCLVDPKMEIFHKINQRKRNKLEDEKEEKSDFVKIAEKEEFSVENFMGLENGMMIRNRLIHEKLDEMEQEKITDLKDMEKNVLEMCFEIKKISMVLCKGGYFSFVSFDKMKELIRKSDHKYVVRKKQGGRQILAIGNSSSSIGGQIR